MTFNAGTIESSFDVDRTPFQNGLNWARSEARKFAAEKYKIRFDVDLRTTEARRALREFRSEQQNNNVKLKAEIDLSEAHRDLARLRAEVAALRGSLGGIGGGFGPNGPNGGGPNGGGGSGGRGGNETADQLNLLLDAALALGPALIPLASGLAGISSSALAVGANVVLGIGGAKKEIEDATEAGLQFAGALNTIKGVGDDLQRTAAKGLLPDFRDLAVLLNERLPELRSFIERTAPVTGQIVGSGAETLLNIFEQATPLIETAQVSVAKMMGELESWSEGQDATDFFAALKDDIPLATEALGDLIMLAANIVEAFDPIGEVMLKTIDGVADFVNMLDRVPGLLSSVATGLVAWRIAALAAAGANKLLAASGIAAATSATNPDGSPRGPGPQGTRFQRGAAFAGKALPWLLAGSIGVQGLNSAVNGDSVGYTDGGQQFGSQFVAALSDIFSGDFSLGNTNRTKAANQRAEDIQWRQADTDKLIARITGQQSLNYKGASLGVYGDINARGAIYGASRPDITSSIGGTGMKVNNDPLGYYDSTAYGDVLANRGRMDSARYNTVGKESDPQQIAAGQKAITDSIQKRIDAQKKLFDTSNGEIKLADDLSVSYDAYEAKLKETGYNINATVNYFRGQRDQLKDNRTEIKDLAASQQNYNDFLATTSEKYNLTAQQVGMYSAALGLNYDEISKTAASSEHASDALGALADKFRNGNQAVQGWLSAVSQVDPKTATLTDKVGLLGAALQALQGTTLSMATTNLTAATSAEEAANAIARNSASIDKNGNLLGQLVKRGKDWVVTQPMLSKGALEAAQAMSAAGSSAIQLAQSIYQNTGNAETALDAYNGLRQQFIETEVQAGRTREAAENLATQIYGVPKDAKTFVRLLNKDNVAAAIRDLTGKLVDFGNIVATAVAAVGGNAGPTADAIRAKMLALNGLVTTSYADLLIRVKSIGDTSAGAGKRNGGTSEGRHGGGSSGSGKAGDSSGPSYMGNLFRYFADGGMVKRGDRRNQHMPEIARAMPRNTVRVFAEEETLGETYIPHANDWRRPRAKELLAETARMFGGTAFFAGGGKYPSLQTENPDGSPVGSSSGGSGSSKKKGLSDKDKKYNNSLDDYLNNLTSEFSALSGIAGQSVSELRSNLGDLDRTLTALRKKGFTDKKVVRDFERENKDILRLAKERDKIGRQLDGYTDKYGTSIQGSRSRYQQTRSDYDQYRDSVRNAALGGFDITTDGNGYGAGILASVKSTRADLSKFTSLRNQAQKLGLDPRLLEQITAAGPEAAGANLEALVKGGKGLISQVNAEYKPIAAAAANLGKDAAEDKYRKTLNSQRAVIDKEVKRLGQVTDGMAKDLGDILKIVRSAKDDIKARKRT